MEQAFLFPELEPCPRLLLNENGIDLSKMPFLDFTTKNPKKPNKARKIKTEKMFLLKDIEEKKYMVFPTGDTHVSEKYKKFGNVFPYVYNFNKDGKIPVRLSRCKYPSLTVSTKFGKSIDFLVHELFAIAFLKNEDPENFYMVDHEDDDHLNYELSNLGWITNSDNQKKAAMKKKNSLECLDDYMI